VMPHGQQANPCTHVQMHGIQPNNKHVRLWCGYMMCVAAAKRAAPRAQLSMPKLSMYRNDISSQHSDTQHGTRAATHVASANAGKNSSEAVYRHSMGLFPPRATDSLPGPEGQDQDKILGTGGDAVLVEPTAATAAGKVHPYG
jgi:hypothetical protein